MALKSCDTHRWPLVPPVSALALLVAGDEDSAEEGFREDH
jgi:hypothetical protein